MPPVGPIDVWDSRDYKSWWNKWDGKSPGYGAAIEWALENIEDLNYVYRIEFYVFDTAFCVVFRYAKGFNGKLVVFPPTGEATKEDPVIQIVPTLPFPGWRKPELALYAPTG
jgi:hypothetical protein